MKLPNLIRTKKIIKKLSLVTFYAKTVTYSFIILSEID